MTSDSVAQKPGLKHLFRIPGAPQLVLTRSVSVFGDMLVPLALAFAVLEHHSATALGLVLAARALTSVLLLPVGGLVGDNAHPRRVLLVAQLVSVATQAATGLVLVQGSYSIALLCALVAMRGAASAFYNPALSSLTASLTTGRMRQYLYGLLSTTSNISEIAGPAVAGVMLIVIEPGWLLIADSVTFGIGFACCLYLPRPPGRDVPRQQRPKYMAQLREGIAVALGSRWLRYVIGTSSVYQALVLPAISVLGPLVAVRHLGGAQAWGVIAAALGAGGVVGSVISVKLRARRPLYVAYLLLLGGSTPTLFLLAVPATTGILAASEFVAGMTIAIFSTMESIVIADRVPRHAFARVDSVNRMGSAALRPAGMALIGVVAGAIGLRTTLLVWALAVLVCVAWPLTSREIRTIERATVTD